MKYGFKYILKKIIPPPISVFNREVGSIKTAVLEQTSSLRNAVVAQNENIKREFIKQNKCLEDLLTEQNREVRDAVATQREEFRKQLSEQREHFEYLIAEQNREFQKSIAAQNENHKKLFSEQHEFFENMKIEQTAMLLKQQEILNGIERVRQKNIEGQRFASEAVWAQIFKDTIQDSKWLIDKTFSPGRWAAGYPFLYVLYRVLNEMRPKRILELGLGQTTKMIAQYAVLDRDVIHTVVENDSDWIAFFSNSFLVPDQTKIVQLDVELASFKNANGVRVYKGFAETFCYQEFDLICIDAPWAGDMTEYGRIDVLGILPHCIGKNFVIIVDDCDRNTEQRTVEEIIKCLDENGIEYKKGTYRGSRDTVLICSKHLRFLASM